MHALTERVTQPHPHTCRVAMGATCQTQKKHDDHEKSALRQCTLLQRLRRTMSKDSSPDSLKQTRRKSETRESAVRFDSFRFDSSALKRCRMERLHTIRLHTYHATCASGQKQKTQKWRVANDILTIQREHT